MLSPINQFYEKREEPLKGTFLALRDLILSLDTSISNTLKYGMPFFSYKGKMFCYLWTDKKTKQPYIGIVEGNRINHPSLEQGNRSRMKIFRIHMEKDIPVKTIESILNEALGFYRDGIIKIKQRKN
ncbi:MAG: DUF1801 domain-containing protein [Cellulophaga sp.]